MQLLSAALYYNKNGISCIATGQNKRALYSWKEYQTRIPTKNELQSQFSNENVQGIAIICGQVSGNIEVIDVDLKYDTSGNLWERLQEQIGDDLLQKLYCVKTKSGGYHLYYKCESIEGNLKLANRLANADELKDNPHIKQVVLIETRGEGGYVIAPPTEGYKKKNAFVINVITSDEREQLFTACRSFDEIVTEVKIETKSEAGYSLSPWEDYNNRVDAVQLLTNAGWIVVTRQGERTIFKRPGITDSRSSGDFHHGKNLFKVFTTSSEFEPGKGYKPFAIYAKLHHNDDFSAAARQLKADGYGKQSLHIDKKLQDKLTKWKSEGLKQDDIIDKIIADQKISRIEAKEINDDYDLKSGPVYKTFWDVVNGKIIINRNRLMQWLKDKGYGLYFYDSNSKIYRLIKVKDGLINEATTEGIKKDVINYLKELPDKVDGINKAELIEKIMSGGDTYFGNNSLEFLERIDINLLKDTVDAAYFPFIDGIVKVTESGSNFITYGSLKKSMWESQVINMEFKGKIENDFDIDKCEFAQFTEFICKNEKDRNNKEKKDKEKIEYLWTLIGYLLHKYKDASKPFAVILAEENENEKDGGGTGKGILVKALSHILNVERVDGKNFKLDKSFAFQRVGLDTNIIAIEDVRKNVDFEGFYSIITEGVTVEKKNKDELFIPYEDSPKILFTTNYTINSTGNHAKRRQKVFEFSNYFNSRWTPIDEFKHKLLDKDAWQPEEWERFYNFMFMCVQAYLVNGIKYKENGNKLNRKHIRINYTEEFLEWWDTFTADLKSIFKPFRDLYGDFLNSNDLDKKDYSQKRFKKAIEECCEKFGYQLISQRNGQSRILEYKITKLGTFDSEVSDFFENGSF